MPSYAVMYKLKPEYMTQSYDVATADHNEYCKEFERLLQSETITLHNSKGVVILFAGHSAADKGELSDEVDRFIDKDPLIEQGIVDTWNILDLDPYVVEGGPGMTPDGVVLKVDTSNDDVLVGEVVKSKKEGESGGGEDGGDDENDGEREGADPPVTDDFENWEPNDDSLG